MTLTGHAGGRPLAPPAPVIERLQTVAHDIADASARVGNRVDVDVPAVLTGRAERLALSRRGRRSAGGAARLLRAADGWVVVSLARAADVEAVGAVVQETVRDGDAWRALETYAAGNAGGAVAERVQLLGIPGASLPGREAGPSVAAVRQRRAGGAVAGRRSSALVVDLSSMWAGPLAARILGRVGFRIVKVEDVRRPDGARAGDAIFYDWLHSGHESVAVDFGTATGVAALRALLAGADIVIEASRPRALEQLGIDATSIVAARPGTTWLSITGYGRRGDSANRVAFGDDAAVAGGLVAYDADDAPVFAADAIADPVTGLMAARAALGSYVEGGGHVVEVTMAGAAAAIAAAGSAHDGPVVTRDGDSWAARCCGRAVPLAAPRRLVPDGRAEPLGASTASVLAGLERPAAP
jgi:hypothetical protein